MSADEALYLHLRELEESLLQADVRKSGRVTQLLAEGFVEFGSSGRTFTKDQIISMLAAETSVRITATAFNVELLSPDVAIVTYRAQRHSEPPNHTLRCSIWKLQYGNWKMVFHQGTISSALE